MVKQKWIGDANLGPNADPDEVEAYRKWSKLQAKQYNKLGRNATKKESYQMQEIAIVDTQLPWTGELED